VRGVDTTKPFAEWSSLKHIIAQLHHKYSEALDVELRIGGAAKELF
jgi:hypothetical protein